MQLKEHIKRILASPGCAVVVAFVVRMVLLRSEFKQIALALRDIPFGYEVGSVAAAIASGRGFSSPLHAIQTGATAWFVPIYPYLLAGIFKLCGIYSYKSNLVIHTVDVAFSALTCWPIYDIGRTAFGKRTGIAAAWVWVALPTSLFFSIVWIWDTTLAAFWMAILMAVTLRLRGSPRLRSWIGYGVLWAVGAMINPSIVTVLPVLGLWAIWPLRQNLAQVVKLAAAASAIFFLCISPWVLRNFVVFHQFIPLRSNFGLELWLGNNPAVPDSWTPDLHPNDNPAEAAKYAQMTEIPYMQEKQREGFAFMRTHPADATRFIVHRFVNNWVGLWESPLEFWSKADLTARLTISSNCLFALLALFGTLLASRVRNEAATPFALVLLVFPILFYLTHTSLRYRFPIDPLMEVLAVYAVAYPLGHLLRRRSEVGSAGERPARSFQAAD